MLYYGWLAGLLPFVWLFWLLAIGVFGALCINIIRLSGKALSDWDQTQSERNDQLRGASFLTVLVLVGLHAFGVWDPIDAVYNNWKFVGMCIGGYLGIGFLYMNLNGAYEVWKERRRRRRKLIAAKEEFFGKKKKEYTGTTPFNPTDYQDEWQEWKESSELLTPPDVSSYRGHLISWMLFWTPHFLYRITVGWIDGIKNFFRMIIDALKNVHQAFVNWAFKDIDRGI